MITLYLLGFLAYVFVAYKLAAWVEYWTDNALLAGLVFVFLCVAPATLTLDFQMSK